MNKNTFFTIIIIVLFFCSCTKQSNLNKMNISSTIISSAQISQHSGQNVNDTNILSSNIDTNIIKNYSSINNNINNYNNSNINSKPNTNSNISINSTTTVNSSNSISSTGKSKYQMILDENLRHDEVISKIDIETRQFTDVCNLRIEALTKIATPYYGSKSEYDLAISTFNRDISRIINQLSALQPDDSAWAMKRKLELQDELSKKETELRTLIDRHSVQQQIYSINDELTNVNSKQQNLIDAENTLNRNNLYTINSMNK